MVHIIVAEDLCLYGSLVGDCGFSVMALALGEERPPGSAVRYICCAARVASLCIGTGEEQPLRSSAQAGVGVLLRPKIKKRQLGCRTPKSQNFPRTLYHLRDFYEEERFAEIVWRGKMMHP